MQKLGLRSVLAVAILSSVSLVAMVGCEGGGGGGGDGSGGTTGVAGVPVLASGNAVITGGGHLLATVTAPTNGTMNWTITRVAGGTGIVGLSVDINQGATVLAHQATQAASISTHATVTAGQSYDLMASTSDADVTIAYAAQMQ